jgi:hypothetical protein
MIGNRTIAEQPRPFAGDKGSAIGKHLRSRHLLRLMIAAAVLLFFVLGIITGYLEKWLWMRQLDYSGIFWTLLSVRWAMFCSAFVFAFLYLWINLRQAARNSAALRGEGRAGGPAFLSGTDAVAQTGLDFPPRLLNLAAVLVSAGVALFFALGFTPNGIPTSAFVTEGPSACPIRSSGSMSDSISFICPSMGCCKPA